MASPSLLAYIAVGKYADALPLYRQEGIFGRLGIDLPRATQASWMIRCGQLIVPLLKMAKCLLLQEEVIQADETRIQILKQSGKTATSKSYMWVFLGGKRDGPPIVLFELGPSRSHTVPLEFLMGYEGFLQTDGYEAYETLATKNKKIRLVGDWAHVRRRFDEAIKAVPADFKGEIKAQIGFNLINELFRIEREEMVGASDEDRLRIRREKSKPVIDAIKVWADKTLPGVPPKSLTGIGLNYLLERWSKLIIFLDHACLRLDTNPVENAIRPFVVGRNNWLFSATVDGAEASAGLYSLICMARHNGLSPFDYLKAVFTELPKATTDEDISRLLPWNWQPVAVSAV
jgi:transposase